MVSAEGVAWAFMSEGSIYVYVNENKSKDERWTVVLPAIEISNSDEEFIGKLAEWLNSKGIKATVLPVKGGKRGRKTQYRISLRGDGRCRRLLELVSGHYVGVYRKQAELMQEFIKKFKRPSGKKLPRLEGKRRVIEMMEFREKINSLNGKSGTKKKFNADYFRKEWDMPS